MTWGEAIIDLQHMTDRVLSWKVGGLEGSGIF